MSSNPIEREGRRTIVFESTLRNLRWEVTAANNALKTQALESRRLAKETNQIRNKNSRLRVELARRDKSKTARLIHEDEELIRNRDAEILKLRTANRKLRSDLDRTEESNSRTRTLEVDSLERARDRIDQLHYKNEELSNELATWTEAQPYEL